MNIKNNILSTMNNVIVLRRFYSKVLCFPRLIRIVIYLIFHIICIPLIPFFKKVDTEIQKYNFAKESYTFLYDNREIHFYLPNLLYDDGTSDFIQKIIFVEADFYESAILKYIKNTYIKPNFIILDIGSNIGNHAVYWGKICEAEKIYCFEPINTTFNVLQKNINLNNLTSNTVCFNCAVGKSDGLAEINSFSKNNIGGTSIKECEDGDMKIIAIDNIESIDRVNFIKIDVEGFEYNVLQGCLEILKRHKPIIYIEINPSNFSQVDLFFKDNSYFMDKKFDKMNYVYKSNSSS